MLRHFKPATCAIVWGLLVAGMPNLSAPAIAQAQPSWIIPDLLAPAKAEGELIVYGSMNEEEALPFWQIFQDASGIKVNYVRSSDANILARIAIEYRARQRSWDLVATTPVYRLPDEVLPQFEPPEAKNLIPQARGPNRRWFSFDPKYERFTHYDLGGTYGNEVGQNGDQWFTSFVEDGPIARVTKDGVLSKFYPPTKGKPQRLQVDADGTVWFTERRGGKIGHFEHRRMDLRMRDERSISALLASEPARPARGSPLRGDNQCRRRVEMVSGSWRKRPRY